jgi:hypothetical protein
LDGAVVATSILSPCGLVKSTDFLAHRNFFFPSHSPNQSIPRITSIPLDVRTTRSAWKSIPLILRLTHGHTWVDFISPFGDLTNKCAFTELIGISCFATNCSVLKECDAPESNKTITGTELIGNVSSTIPGASWTCSTVTWFTLPRTEFRWLLLIWELAFPWCIWDVGCPNLWPLSFWGV